MSEFCETITITKTDASKDICEGDYTFDAVAREYVHSTNPNCRLSKYIDFDSGEYKWRAYHWVPSDQPQPAGSTLSAQWTMPPTIVCASTRYKQTGLGHTGGVPSDILDDHLTQILINDGGLDGSPELSTYPGKPNMSMPGIPHDVGATWESGKGVYADSDPTDSPEYTDENAQPGQGLPKDRWVLNGVCADDPFRGDPAPQDPAVTRWGAKYNTRTSKYWGDEPSGSTTPPWSIEHRWIKDENPNSQTFGQVIGHDWDLSSNFSSDVGILDQMLINVYVIDPTQGIVDDTGMTSGGKVIPYREATINDGTFGESQYAGWVGGILWEFNTSTQRLEIVQRPSDQQNYPVFQAGAGGGSDHRLALLNANGLKTVISDNICFLHQNYYGENVNYDDYIGSNDANWARQSGSGRQGFEKHWLGATFSFFEDADSLTPEYLEVKMISQDADFVNWVSSGNQGPCASMGWYRGVGIETTSDMAELCPTDADWSGTGIEISIPGQGGGATEPATGPTDLNAQQDGGGGGTVVPTVGPTNLVAQQSTPTAGPTILVAQQGVVPASGPTNLTAVQAVGDPVFTGDTLKPKYLGYVFDERTDGVSGPFASEHITTVTTKDNSAEMLCVNEGHEVKKTDLLEFNNAVFPKFTDPFGDITAPFDTTTEKGIVCSETGEGFLYRGRYMSAPFEEPVDGPGTVKNPLFFKDSHLAIAETNWLHLGDEHNEKQCYRVDLSFRKNSCGYLWLYVKGEDEKVKGQYKGKIKEHMKVFTNLRGRCFRIQMFVATHNDCPWAMREMAIGHLYGKSF